MTIPIAIAHAGYDPARKPGLRRLQEQVPNAHVFTSERREHASVWARRLWQWAAGHGGTCVLLNDDVTVCPDFPAVVEAMTRAVPDQVIALHTTAPAAPSLAMCGERWLRSYWLTGPGYILPAGAAQRLLKWVAHAPKQLIASVNEDNVIMHWAWSEQRPIWHCIPALVQHDVSVPSTLGYDAHPMRQTEVAWDAPGFTGSLSEHDLTHAGDWYPGGRRRYDECLASPNLPLLVECPWMPTLQLARQERAFWDRPELCCLCHSRDGGLTAGSGARVCTQCVVNCVGALSNLATANLTRA